MNKVFVVLLMGLLVTGCFGNDEENDVTNDNDEVQQEEREELSEEEIAVIVRRVIEDNEEELAEYEEDRRTLEGQIFRLVRREERLASPPHIVREVISQVVDEIY